MDKFQKEDYLPKYITLSEDTIRNIIEGMLRSDLIRYRYISAIIQHPTKSEWIIELSPSIEKMGEDGNAAKPEGGAGS